MFDSKMFRKRIGETLRFVRTNAEISMAELCQATGEKLSTLEKAERGDIEVSLTVFVEWCLSLRMSPVAVLFMCAEHDGADTHRLLTEVFNDAQGKIGEALGSIMHLESLLWAYHAWKGEHYDNVLAEFGSRLDPAQGGDSQRGKNPF